MFNLLLNGIFEWVIIGQTIMRSYNLKIFPLDQSDSLTKLCHIRMYHIYLKMI